MVLSVLQGRKAVIKQRQELLCLGLKRRKVNLQRCGLFFSCVSGVPDCWEDVPA